ncbi:hypothetical protein KXX29_006089, partial [Aspergillus fumigatus]
MTELSNSGIPPLAPSSILFSRDGQLLASGSDDETIKLWDPTTSILMQTLEGHSDS